MRGDPGQVLGGGHMFRCCGVVCNNSAFGCHTNQTWSLKIRRWQATPRSSGGPEDVCLHQWASNISDKKSPALVICSEKAKDVNLARGQRGSGGSGPPCCRSNPQTLYGQGLGKAGSGGSANPRKIWSWGQKLHMLFFVLTNAFIICIEVSSPLCCINNQLDFKGWGENQCIMLHDKTWFLTPPPLNTGFRAPESEANSVKRWRFLPNSNNSNYDTHFHDEINWPAVAVPL